MLITLLKFSIAIAAGSFLLFRYQPRQAQLSVGRIISAYLFRIGLGCLYGYILLNNYPNDDTNLFHRLGVDEYHELLDNPSLFFSDFFSTNAFNQGRNLIEKLYYYLFDWEKWILIKMLAIFNCFSGGNYYINIVLLNIISFKGSHYLYAAIKKYFHNADLYPYLITFYFAPVIFWLSGIRGEALLIFCIGLLVYSLEILKTKKSRLLLISLSLLFILIIRNQLFLLFIPALIAYALSSVMKSKPISAFFFTYLGIILLVLVVSWLSDSFDILSLIAQKQASFKKLPSGSIYILPDLDSNFISYIQALPAAILNVFFRPFFIDAVGYLQIAASLETLVMISLFLYWLKTVFIKGSMLLYSPFLLLLFFYAISVYLMIGLLVPFPGAIIRYRCIPELLLVICFSIDILKFKLLPKL